MVVLEEPIGPDGDWAAHPLCETADLENQSWHPEPDAEPNDPARIDETCTVCADRYRSFDEGGLVL